MVVERVLEERVQAHQVLRGDSPIVEVLSFGEGKVGFMIGNEEVTCIATFFTERNNDEHALFN